MKERKAKNTGLAKHLICFAILLLLNTSMEAKAANVAETEVAAWPATTVENVVEVTTDDDTKTVKLLTYITTASGWEVSDPTYKYILDLNDYGIRYSGTENKSVITAKARTKLTITDTSNMTDKYISLSSGRGTVVSDSGSEGENTVKVTGGYITGGSNKGGGINAKSASTIDLRNGTITGNTAGDTGGGVWLFDGGTLNMSGGKILKNKSQKGGGIFINGGTCNLSGGEVSQNTATADGGGIYQGNTSVLNMTGGKVENNTAQQKGGGVYNVSTGTNKEFTFSGGSISNNTASACGGGIYNSGYLTITGGQITGNTTTTSSAGYGGGGIFNFGSTQWTVKMSGGSITNNSSSMDGGGIYHKDGGFELSGGTISGNTASKKGGGICYNRSSSQGFLVMSGGTIENNSASESGGGLDFIQGECRISGNPVIKGNKKGTAENNVFMRLGNMMYIEGALTGANQSIGVTKDEAGTSFSGPYSTADAAHVDASKFFSDDIGRIVKKGASDNYLYIYVKPSSYTVTFDANGHGTAPSSQTVAVDGYSTEPDAPVADGWEFKGWYKESGCINPWNFATDIVSDDTTLYAKWAIVLSDGQKPEPKAGLTSTGSPQELVTVPGTSLPDGYTLQYSLGTDAVSVPDNGWSTAIPTGTDVKTYYVWYKAKGDESHSDSDADVVTVTIKEKTEAHTHKIEHVEAKEPTCTEDGYEAHYECTECDKWFNDLVGQYPLDETEKAEMTKKATGHKWDDGVITQEATYDETGIKTYTCSVCGETKVETIPVKIRRSSSSSDSSDSDSDSSGGGSSGKSGSISTKSIDVNGNTVQTQPDSGAPLSDRGGNWGNQEHIWTYTKSDGNLAKGEWLNLDYNGHTYWYYFDDSTIMQTNWFDYNGSRYFLVPEMDGWRGRMATGWHQVDNKWYYFEPTVGANQGILYRGMTTPDGHTVGADGSWDGNGTTPVGAIHTGTTVTMN